MANISLFLHRVITYATDLFTFISYGLDVAASYNSEVLLKL
jgi:hypothetical protein